MEIINIAYSLVVMMILIAGAAVLSRVIPLHRLLTAEDNASGRLLTIDGLRGILAPCVFLHHAVLYFYFLRTGLWQEMSSNLYSQMGVLPVTLFFFVTGYLFWSKLMKRPVLNFGDFLRDRFGRLGGAYFLACLLLFAMVAVESNLRRQVSLSRLILEGLAWLSFLGAGHDINGVFDSKRLLGQVWTLRLEWMFYLSLPFLGWFARRRLRLPLLLVGAGLLSYGVEKIPFSFSVGANYVWQMLGNYAHTLLTTFSVGMIIAALPVTKTMKAWTRGRLATAMSLLLLVVTASYLPPRYGWQESMMLTLPFACVCYGNSCFGLLTSVAVRSLGRVSYSFYLLHVFALQVGMAVLSKIAAPASLTLTQYWMVVAVSGSGALVASFLSYQFFEHPFLKKTTAATVNNSLLRPKQVVMETPLWL